MSRKKSKSKKSKSSRKASSFAKLRVPQFRYFTRELLIQAAELGPKWDYNRQLSERIAEVPEGKYFITFTMFHYHRRFVPCEQHVRCMISLHPFKQTYVLCDVPVEFFQKLPHMPLSRRVA